MIHSRVEWRMAAGGGPATSGVRHRSKRVTNDPQALLPSLLMESHSPTPGPVQRRPGEDRTFEECEHIVRDDDPDTALCGVDQTGIPWNQGFRVCQACAAIAEGRMN